MAESKKPRICEVLGVEVGEEFNVEPNTMYGRKSTYRISMSGYLQVKGFDERWRRCDGNTAILVDVINGRSSIIHKTKFKVCIEEHLTQEFWVEADDIESAEQIAQSKYFAGEFVVGNGNVNARLMATAEAGDDYPEFNEF